MQNIGTETAPLVIAVVGAGPSGFYAIESLLNSDLRVHINLIEKLPAPFGLVRYGVAPDHPKLKQVSLIFDKIAQHPDVAYFGNVIVGEDVSIEDLKSTHHAVILCNGASSDRRLEIPGEDLKGSHTATEFVAWYNGHPDYRDYEFDLSHDVAVIIGQGNVAADVCRILSKPVDELRSTDIANHALQQLAESKIRDVHVIGRRGPAQAKFTSKELRELGALTHCATSVSQIGFDFEPQDFAELAEKTNDNAVKCVEHFKSFGSIPPTNESRSLTFDFLLSPQEFVGKNQLEKIVFNRNRLEGEAFSRRAIATNMQTEIECGLCFRSIGYRGLPMTGVPFDDRKGIFPNTGGHLHDAKGIPFGQLYTSGWIKRGPSGVIGTNRADSAETVSRLLDSLAELRSVGLRDPEDFARLTHHKNIRSIGYGQWQMIDAAETQGGQNAGKPREKITSIDQMLAIAG